MGVVGVSDSTAAFHAEPAGVLPAISLRLASTMRQAGLDAGRAPQRLARLAPVDADPAARRPVRAVEEPLELVQGTRDREGFLHEHRHADREPLERPQRLVGLALLRVEVDAEEVE